MNSTKHLIDEIKNILDHLPELMKEPITADNLIEKREAYGLIAAEMAREQPAIEGIETFELSSSNSQDNFKVPFFFQAEDGIRDPEMSRGLGDVYKRQIYR